MNLQVTILKVLASYPNGIATFDALKRDLEFLASRGRDWSDRTRRLAAHLPGLSIFSMGLVERHPHGWQLTNKGQSVLQFMEEWDARPQRERSRRLRTTGTRGLPWRLRDGPVTGHFSLNHFVRPNYHFQLSHFDEG